MKIKIADREPFSYERGIEFFYVRFYSYQSIVHALFGTKFISEQTPDGRVIIYNKWVK